MVMKEYDVQYRVRLLERWGYLCIVCGREFANLACVSKEHVIPKSKVKLGYTHGDNNKAPSHHRCNQLRRDRSFIVAAREVDHHERMMHPKQFLAWLNRAIPNRIVPPEALLPLPPLRRRVPQFLELPEYLPGVP